MTPESTQLVIALLTILGSGVVTAIVSYKLTKRREETALYRAKLEQLYLSVTKYVEQLGSHFLLCCRGIDGSLTMDQINEQTIASGKDDDRGFRTAEMMIVIYFPHLHPEFDRILKAREAGNKIYGDFHHGYTHGGWDKPKLYVSMGLVIEELGAAETEIAAAIHATARRINGARKRDVIESRAPQRGS